MNTSDPIFREAQHLAEFSNLESGQIDEFRNAVSTDFFPPKMWEMPGQSLHLDTSVKTGNVWTPEPLWKTYQDVLRETWQNHFPSETGIWLIAHLAKLSRQEQRMREVEQELNSTGVLTMPQEPLPEPESWPFQRAVMYLCTNPWRARFCMACGKRFVAARPKSTYCSDSCFNASRKGTKRAWWKQHGEQWREEKQKTAKKQSKKGGK
jgi:hypothetical protein